MISHLIAINSLKILQFPPLSCHEPHKLPDLVASSTSDFVSQQSNENEKNKLFNNEHQYHMQANWSLPFRRFYAHQTVPGDTCALCGFVTWDYPYHYTHQRRPTSAKKAAVLHVDNRPCTDISLMQKSNTRHVCFHVGQTTVGQSWYVSGCVSTRTRKSNPPVKGTPILLKCTPKHTPHAAVSERAYVCERVCGERGEASSYKLAQLWHGLCSSVKSCDLLLNILFARWKRNLYFDVDVCCNCKPTRHNLCSQQALVLVALTYISEIQHSLHVNSRSLLSFHPSLSPGASDIGQQNRIPYSHIFSYAHMHSWYPLAPFCPNLLIYQNNNNNNATNAIHTWNNLIMF